MKWGAWPIVIAPTEPSPSKRRNVLMSASEPSIQATVDLEIVPGTALSLGQHRRLRVHANHHPNALSERASQQAGATPEVDHRVGRAEDETIHNLVDDGFGVAPAEPGVVLGGVATEGPWHHPSMTRGSSARAQSD